MPKLHFVRHAQSENNLSSLGIREAFWDTPDRMYAEAERARKPDPTLTELGFAQTGHLAERLAPLAAAPRSLLLCSPMRRALLTALPLAQAAQLDHFVCDGELYEVGGCHYCGHAEPSPSAEQLEAEFPVRCQNVHEDGWFAGHVAKESADEARARIDRLIASIETRLAGGAHDDIIIVCHGDLLSRWFRRWLGIPWARGMAFVHANTAVTSFEWHPELGLQLQGLNDTSHLPPALRSGADAGAWWRYMLPDLEIRRHQGWTSLPEALTTALTQLREQHLLGPENRSLSDAAPSDARSLHVVARAEGRLAGYVQYDPEVGRLRQLVVQPDFRGSGLGRRLVAAVEDEVRRQSRDELIVHAWTESRGFYAGMGFEAEGEPVSGEGDEHEWIRMVKAVRSW